MPKIDTCEGCGETFHAGSLRYVAVKADETFEHRADAHVKDRAYLCRECRSQRKAS